MTLAPCLQHTPVHHFGKGYRCSKCGASCSPKLRIRTDAITDGMILAAGAAAYGNAGTHPGYATEGERAAARSAVRDVMVRLGLYDRFAVEIQEQD